MWREMFVIDEHLQMMEEGGSSRGWLAPQHPSKWCQPGSSDAGVPQLSWCLEENSTEGEKADICLTGKQRTRKAGLFYWCPPLEATTRSTTEFSKRNGSAKNAVKEKGFTHRRRAEVQLKQETLDLAKRLRCEDCGVCLGKPKSVIEGSRLFHSPEMCAQTILEQTLPASPKVWLTLSPQRKDGFGVNIGGKLLLQKPDKSQHIFSSALSAEEAVGWGNELCSCSIL